jgi:hypothetical protein
VGILCQYYRAGKQDSEVPEARHRDSAGQGLNGKEEVVLFEREEEGGVSVAGFCGPGMA